MASSQDFLQPVADVRDVPSDSYLILSLKGGKYHIPRQRFKSFSHFFVRVDNLGSHLTMDLASAHCHSLVLDIDVKDDTFQVESYFRDHLVPALQSLLSGKNLTVISAMRKDGLGLHVHCPEISIAYDDYVQLCSYLQPRLSGHGYKLDILTSAMLANSSKPNTKLYWPVSVHYFDEKTDREFSIRFDPSVFEHDLKQAKHKFPKRRDNTDCYFRKLLYLNPYDLLYQVLEFMMPVATPYEPLYKISYPTTISKKHLIEGASQVAEFTYRNTTTMYIHKSPTLQAGGNQWLQTFYYLISNAFAISDFHSDNPALTTWHRRGMNPVQVKQDVFQGVNTLLQADSPLFSKDANTLQTILSFEDGYYFLPVFYALTRQLGIRSDELVQHLRGMLGNRSILDALEKIDPQIIECCSQNFTADTILFCGSNLFQNNLGAREKIAHIVKGLENVIATATSSDQIFELVRRVLERYFPLIMVKFRKSSKKTQKYYWNPVNEDWLEVISPNEFNQLVQYIMTEMSTMPHQKKLFADVSVGTIVSSIMSEASLERSVIEMDKHKWHIRTKEGVLDLLTGHVGGSVPQFYISDRRMNVWSENQREKRIELMSLLQHVDYTKIYTLLTEKTFFVGYLQSLLEDMTDDLLDTLKEKVRETGLYWEGDPKLESMLKCYTHLCKYTSFEYEVLVYLLDVTSSLFVATNYARKFYIFKGETKNGKSKFFQMISSIFGGYCHPIQKESLQSTSGSGAKPELASSIFNCRIVTVEEFSGKVDETYIKELTGDSDTSCRTLYESNMAGIPTAKIFGSTNTSPECTATEAFKERVVTFPFESKFDKVAPSTTCEQVMEGLYPLDHNNFVEESKQGFFMILYYHLIRHMVGGIVPIRSEPDMLLEFKENFLETTDIYNQFKRYGDIQIVKNCMTTYDELKSAVRQFLKMTKNASVQESDLLMRFDEEFGDRRKEEVDISMDDGGYEPLEQPDYFDSPPAPKRVCLEEEEQSFIVYYQDVAIKNLKKEFKK